MAAVVFIAGLAIAEGYRKSSQAYYKRAAKKHGFETLPTDQLGRPLDPETGKPLTKNKARAVAAHRRDLETSHNAMARNEGTLPSGEQLPAYKKQSQEEADYQMALRLSQQQGSTLPEYDEAAFETAVVPSSKSAHGGKGPKLFGRRQSQA